MGAFIETIIFNGCEIEVTGNSWKAHRGYRNSYGVPEEPDEDAGFVIETIMYKGVDVTELLYSVIDKVEEALVKFWDAQDPY